MTQAPTPSMVYDVIEACAKPGCPLCRVIDRWAARFVAAILYEEVTDPHTRSRLKASQGFCREHAWQASAVGGTLLGIAIIYRGILAQADQALAQATPAAKANWWRKFGGQGGTAAGAPGGLAPQAACPACLYIDDMEQAALVAVCDALAGNERLRAGLSRPDTGLCLPHLRRALTVAQAPVAVSFLQETTHDRLAGLMSELDEFVRKYDHRFSQEEWGSERDSWQRAVAWIVGGLKE